MTKINGIEFAETNTVWCIERPFHLFDELIEPKHRALGGPHSGRFLYADTIWGWNVRKRCACGLGFDIVTALSSGAIEADGHLCPGCGRVQVKTVKWVGRRFAGRWEWLPEDRLPDDLRPMQTLKDKM